MIVPLLVIGASSVSAYVVPPAELEPSTYSAWAHKHWVWLHHGQSNQENTTALVNGFLDRDIPVGAVNIDSEWATEFNNFVVNKEKFPDFKSLVSSMHDINVRVTMWTTSMINVENPDYDFCVENDYLVRNGNGEVRPINWWKGSGALIDYSNPDALAWWHSNMDRVLNIEGSGMGIDGFKTDQTDLYITEYILLSGDALGYNNVSLTYRDYANYYYRDFFYYTREYRGDEGLIMSRPQDCALDHITKVCTPSSPYDVMYSGWMGDDDPTFNGLTGCIRKVIYSAWDNYTNFGCDIGGYRGDSSTQNKEVFVRWAQAGAFLPLMENGGGGEHRPWMYDEETVNIYRKFVKEHYKLIPYLTYNGMNSMLSNGTLSAVRPVAQKPAETPDYFNPQPSTYSYLLGNDLLVHPVLNDKSLVQMTFPAGENDVWVNWWNPADKSHDVSGKESDFTFLSKVAFDSYSVYVRKGALLPLKDGPSDSDPLVFTWFRPDATSGIVEATGTVFETPSVGPGMVGVMSLSETGRLDGSISAQKGYPAGWVLVGVSDASVVSRPDAYAATMHMISSCLWFVLMCRWVRLWLRKECFLLETCEKPLMAACIRAACIAEH